MILILLSIQSKVYKNHIFDNLSYDCYFKQLETTQGDKITFIEELSNDKYLPIPWLKAELTTSKYLTFSEKCSSVAHKSRFISSCYAIQGKKSIKREWKITSSKRGVFSIESVVLNSCDILGINEYSMSVKDIKATIMVLPRLISTPELDTTINGIIGDFEVKRNLLTDVFSMRGVRQYSGYERLNRIHWKSSAKTNDLMVIDENFSCDIHVKVFLYIHDNCEENLSEKTLSTACSIAVKLARKNIPVQLDTNLNMKTITSFGENHALNIMRFCAELELIPKSYDFPQVESSSTLVIVTPLKNKVLEYPKDAKTIFVRL
ncbi:MAG: DUF58 domain-containing protein [Oscillospiraceae bacterium]